MNTFIRLVAMNVILAFSLVISFPAHAFQSGENVIMSFSMFQRIARQCAPSISLDTITALVKTESSFHPFAIAVVGGQSYYPRSLNQARLMISALEKSEKSFSVGLGQINSQHFSRLGLKAADLLDPCLNLKVTSDILKDCYKSELLGTPSTFHPSEQEQARMLGNALSCYFSGNSSLGYKLGYVNQVYANRQLTSFTIPSISVLSKLPNIKESDLITPQKSKDSHEIQDIKGTFTQLETQDVFNFTNKDQWKTSSFLLPLI